VAGEKAKVAITRSEFATKAVAEYLGVDKIYTFFDPLYMGQQYICVKNGVNVLDMTFDELTPLEDRVTAMRVALRMEHGNDSQTEGSSPS
jgi:hypothetical protein